MSEKYVVDKEWLVSYEDYHKSHPHGNCDECSKEYGTLGCCSTVSNKWIYNCERGMADYAYNKGFKDGMEEAKTQAELDVAHDIENVAKSNYQKGLSDAWECIKKIQDMPEDVRVEIFDNRSVYHIIRKHTGYEIMEMIKAYEDDKSQIQVGDEVLYHDSTKAIVLDKSLNDVWSVITENECVEEWHVDKFKKTGKHYDQIVDVLKEMSGEE